MTNTPPLREMKPGDLINIPKTRRRAVIAEVLPHLFIYRVVDNIQDHNLLIQDFGTAKKEGWSLIKYEYTAEQKPVVRYNSNGSLFDLPDNTSNPFWLTAYYPVTYINNKYQVTGTSYSSPVLIPQEALVEHRLFDDKEKAQWWADTLNTNIKIAKKLQEINFDNPESPRNLIATYTTGEKDVFNFRTTPDLAFQGAFMFCSEAWDWFVTNDDYTESETTDFVKWYR